MIKLFDDNSSILELKNELAKNPDMNNISISDNDVLMMLNYFDDLKKCKGCKGLSLCKQSTHGYMPKLIEGPNVLYIPCKYKKIELAKQTRNSLIKTLYLPKKILDADLSDFTLCNEERKKCLSYATSFTESYKKGDYKKGMLIEGEFSSGKTYLLAGIANRLALKEIETLLIYFPDLVRDIKSGISNNTVEAKVNMLKEVDILMLDDIGSEMMTPWVRDEIFGPILQYRFLEELPTFFSTNLSSKELLDHFSVGDKKKGGRILSRITSMTAKFKSGEKR